MLCDGYLFHNGGCSYSFTVVVDHESGDLKHWFNQNCNPEGTEIAYVVEPVILYKYSATQP